MPRTVQRDLAGPGVYFERCYYSSLLGGASVAEIAANIRAVGVATTVLATDLGQVENGSPVSGMGAYLAQLAAVGIAPAEIAQMAGATPGRLLGLA